MNKKGIIITAVSIGVAAIVIFGGIKTYQHYQNSNLTAEVEQVSDLNSYYSEGEMSSSGIVTNDQSQDVYALEEKTITEVFVEEGQQVAVGDPLLSYDMTLSNLELEMKELEVATMGSKLEAAKRQLEKLKTTTPVAPEPDVPDEPDIPEEPENTDTGEDRLEEGTPTLPAIPEKDGDAYNYIKKGAKANGGKGTKEKPYVYLCMPSCYVMGEFINSLSADKDHPVYVSLEIHKKNVLTGKLISSWEISGESGLPKMADDSMWSVSTRTQVIEEEPGEPEEPKEPETPEEPEPPEEPDFPYESGGGQQGYTAEELSNMIREKEDEIRDLDLDRRKAEVELEQMKRVSEDGTVTATVNGTVKSIGDKDKPSTDEPFLTVSGSDGLYVSGSLSELQLKDIQVGQVVYANSWESGKSFEATITEISPYPQENSNAWGEGNPNVSYYPYTAYIEDTEGLRNGEYVDLTMTSRQADENGIYLDKAYVREEDGKKYVLKAGEDNRLVKQYVKTGKTVWGQAVEIISGLSTEDRIAFPYGKAGKEGIKVKSDE
ncbi:MAG: HlyD family efflux transporter periplasmic adaptor subunit [Lachnospiraceae bacterium]|nr:HlyD family efflux transporter periplasmic adaptor subunit [Lachnospiraceae bacterium]